MTTAAARTAKLFNHVPEDRLSGPTPCEKLDVSELVAHLGGLGVAFAAAARKDFGDLTGTPPGTDGYHLEADWRDQYPVNVTGLADAWKDPSAWEGMTQVGGVDLPAEVCAMVGLTELVVHGWDVAVSTGQPYEVDDDVADALLAHMTAFTAGGPVEGLFGAAVEIGSDASAFDRTLALSGRDPAWRP